MVADELSFIKVSKIPGKMSKLKALVEDKAHVLGLSYRTVEIQEATAGDDPALGERLTVDMPGEDILVRIVPPFSENDPALEVIVENVLCQWKCDKGEGHSYVGLDLPDFKSRALVAELCNAYSEYRGGKLHIEAFGRERFRQYQYNGWESFIRQVGEVFAIPYAEQQVAAVAACFKEQIKFDLLGESPESMPKVMAAITAPFPRAFDAIQACRSPWGKKVLLLVFMSAYLLKNIDLAKSYATRGLVVNASTNTRMTERLQITDSGLLAATKTVESILNESYFCSVH